MSFSFESSYLTAVLFPKGRRGVRGKAAIMPAPALTLILQQVSETVED